MKTNVAVVIPNWNGADFIADALASLSKQTLKSQIIVVDNGSTDASSSIIKTKFPDVGLLEFADNAGFAGGVNRGIHRALELGCDYVALLNNDAVADKHWLEKLVKAAEAHPEAGIVTGKLMRDDKNHFDSTGDIFTTHAMPYPRGRNIVDKGQYDTAEYVFGASGGASLYRTDMLKKIGLFDEGFFAYFEDVDISFRAQLAGWKVWYEPRAVAYHKVSATSATLGSFSRYHSTKNYIYVYGKNMPGYLFWRYKFWFFIRLARMALGSIKDGYPLAFIKAFFVAAWNIPSTLRKRRKIQKTRKVSVGYIKSLMQAGGPERIPKL